MTAGAVAPAAAATQWGDRWRRVGLRLAAGGLGAVALGALRIHRPPELGTLCVLRATTGIPCPACGSTTAFVRLGQGRLLDALVANPVVLLVAVCVVLAPTGVFARLGRLPQRLLWPVVLTVTGGSWLWQLGRYGWLGSWAGW